MATMHTELTLPTLPRWATDGGATLEPSEAKKDEGNVLAKRPPARWDNWLKHQNWLYCKQTLRTVISNWLLVDFAVLPTVGRCVIFHPEQGIWIMVDNNAPSAWTSYNGHKWTLESAAGAPENRSIAIDSTYTMIGLAAGAILRRDSAGTYVTITGVTIGGSGGVDTMITKYPSSDFMMCTRTGVIRIAATGITGSWAAATTPPPSPVTTQNQELLWAGTSTFYLMQGWNGTTKTYVSIDDGDNWAVTSAFPFAGMSSGAAYDMAYNPDSDILVCVGDNDSGDARIEYSADQGATWTAATIDLDGIPATDLNVLRCVYYAGQGHWVAAGSGSGSVPGIVVSSDGINWAVATVNSDYLANTIYDIHASTKMLTMASEDGPLASLGTGAFNP